MKHHLIKKKTRYQLQISIVLSPPKPKNQELSSRAFSLHKSWRGTQKEFIYIWKKQKTFSRDYFLLYLSLLTYKRNLSKCPIKIPNSWRKTRKTLISGNKNRKKRNGRKKSRLKRRGRQPKLIKNKRRRNKRRKRKMRRRNLTKRKKPNSPRKRRKLSIQGNSPNKNKLNSLNLQKKPILSITN